MPTCGECANFTREPDAVMGRRSKWGECACARTEYNINREDDTPQMYPNPPYGCHFEPREEAQDANDTPSEPQ